MVLVCAGKETVEAYEFVFVREIIKINFVIPEGAMLASNRVTN